MSLRVIILTSFTLIAGLILLCCSAEKEPQGIKENVPIVDSLASADGTMIHYQISGKGEPTLVFVHCWECDMSYWENQVDVFNKNYKVVTLDLAGHGQSVSDRKNYSMQAYGEDVAAVVHHLEPDKIILIGHSMGGLVNIEAARRLGNKVLALIGVDTYNDFDFKYPEEQVQQYIQALEADFYSTTMGFVRGIFPSEADSMIVKKIAEDMATASPEVGISSIRNVAAYDYIEALKDVSAPFFLINSDANPIDTIAGNKYTSSFNVKTMNGVGHFLHIERPDQFNQLLEATIQEITAKYDTR